MAYHILHREWKAPSAFWYLIFVELGLTVALLVLFGIQQPDLMRTALWQAGDDMNFNSSPKIILYAYANYEPLPTLPFVWSQTLTDYNVAISVISLFTMLSKLIAYIMHVYFPLIATLVNLTLVALYAASIGGQAGPDYLDPARPSSTAWYIAKSCSVTPNHSVQSSCKMAKGTFAATVLMLVVCLANLGMSIWAQWPDEQDKRGKGTTESDGEESVPERDVEMQGLPQTPKTANAPVFTPRTTAFNALDRKLPLRQ